MERLKFEDPTIRFQFDLATRKEIKNRQRRRCASCGVKTRDRADLQAHHRVPESMGGSNLKENGVGLCNGQYNKCHQKADRMALDQHLIFNPQTKSFDPIETVPRTLFESGVNPHKNGNGHRPEEALLI